MFKQHQVEVLVNKNIKNAKNKNQIEDEQYQNNCYSNKKTVLIKTYSYHSLIYKRFLNSYCFYQHKFDNVLTTFIIWIVSCTNRICVTLYFSRIHREKKLRACLRSCKPGDQLVGLYGPIYQWENYSEL